MPSTPSFRLPALAGGQLLRRTYRALPVGDTLPRASWDSRHGWICRLLWAHVLLLPAIGAVQGNGLVHSALEASPVLGLTLAAASSRLGHRARSSAATLGLVLSSALLVHFSGGLVEMHFHFFVVVVVVSLYQSWLPFLLALGVVVLHHGVAGTVDPASVYNHPAALANPWLWAAIHAGFVLAASLAALVAWRLNEDTLERERRAHIELAAAQQVAAVGSWEWDLRTDELSWSDELHRLLQVDLVESPSLDMLLDRIHPDDRERVAALIEAAHGSGSEIDYEARTLLPDGTTGTMHARGTLVVAADDGQPVKMRGTCQDITERKALEQEIEYRAFYDGLTGLANRSLFMDRLEHAVVSSQRSDAITSVLFIDLDGFKAINDTLGHRAGDQLLIEVARRLRASGRASDTVARLGGDELAILLEDTDTTAAHRVVERLLANLAAPALLGHHVLPCISASIGVADTEQAADCDELLHHADVAMYVAKRRTEPSYEVFHASMTASAAPALSTPPGLG